MARIEYLRVKNFRALKDVELRNITPLTALLGPNGSGKSTVFDVFAFLSECFENGLRRAWDRRGRGRELKTRGSTEPLSIEIKYRESIGLPLVTYHLSVDEIKGAPVIIEEWLSWRRGSHGKPFRFLDFKEGSGRAVSGELPDIDDERAERQLSAPDLIAVNALGQFADHPRVTALRNFITGWYVSYFSVDMTRGQPEAGPQERLSRTGDNLANVVQYLAEQHPDRLEEIFKTLRRRIPQIDRVLAEAMPDGRLLLTIKDGPFDNPILAKFASDGTLKMLAYLVLLYDPDPAPFIGVEEPENFLHPRLLYELAEECRVAAQGSQVLVTTHSPFFINALKSEEVRVLYRTEDGYTKVKSASEIRGINEFLSAGALLGDLWVEGHFGVGDPLSPSMVRPA
ncbi:AAA family ATPase [Salipiger mucosus]|uniref:AAA family ATPase n=1 Tax=Salipiger mucosus TaxID=263378 RepID=UPI000A04A234|nr:AAA family ATPase [Salipiger mucosus]